MRANEGTKHPNENENSYFTLLCPFSPLPFVSNVYVWVWVCVCVCKGSQSQKANANVQMANMANGSRKLFFLVWTQQCNRLFSLRYLVFLCVCVCTRSPCIFPLNPLRLKMKCNCQDNENGPFEVLSTLKHTQVTKHTHTHIHIESRCKKKITVQYNNKIRHLGVQWSNQWCYSLLGDAKKTFQRHICFNISNERSMQHYEGSLVSSWSGSICAAMMILLQCNCQLKWSESIVRHHYHRQHHRNHALNADKLKCFRHISI